MKSHELRSVLIVVHVLHIADGFLHEVDMKINSVKHIFVLHFYNSLHDCTYSNTCLLSNIVTGSYLISGLPRI